MIDCSGIKNFTIIPLLKMLLKVDPTKRASLTVILNHSFFEYNQNSIIDIKSLLPTSYKESNFLTNDMLTSVGQYT